MALKASDKLTAKGSEKSFAEAILFEYDFSQKKYYSPLIKEGFVLKCKPIAHLTLWKWSYDYQWDEYVHKVKW